VRWGHGQSLRYFAELKGPRVERTEEHPLEEILLIAMAAILSGAGGWNEIENDGKAKIDWLRSFLTLPAGLAGIGAGLCGVGDVDCPVDVSTTSLVRPAIACSRSCMYRR
jgi:hypothetical protein